MSRRDAARLGDIRNAIEAIRGHLQRGGLDDGLVYDAVRVRLIEIGEAVKSIDPVLLAAAPEVPWKAVARMRDHLAHHYFDTDHAIVQDVIDNELDPLTTAIDKLSALDATQRPVDGVQASADGPPEAAADPG